MSLVHIDTATETEKIDKGYWQCEHGKWISKEIKDCYCEALLNDKN